MTRRREFTPTQRRQIVSRATDDNGTIRCEGCHLALKAGEYEIDHTIAEGLVPDWKKAKPLTIKEGQLLGTCCHRGEDGKTKRDVKRIAKSNRQMDKNAGLKRPKQKLQGRGLPGKPRKHDGRESLPPRAIYQERNG